MPTTSAGLDGLTEMRLSPVEMDSGPMRRGYSRPNSECTFLRAISMPCRLAGWEKSVTGSLRNWERVAVAILFYIGARNGENAKGKQERRRLAGGCNPVFAGTRVTINTCQVSGSVQWTAANPARSGRKQR